jgi:hypothetical protein
MDFSLDSKRVIEINNARLSPEFQFFERAFSLARKHRI